MRRRVRAAALAGSNEERLEETAESRPFSKTRESEVVRAVPESVRCLDRRSLPFLKSLNSLLFFFLFSYLAPTLPIILMFIEIQ